MYIKHTFDNKIAVSFGAGTSDEAVCLGKTIVGFNPRVYYRFHRRTYDARFSVFGGYEVDWALCLRNMQP